MRISDWSSDVCSSDLFEADFQHVVGHCLDLVDHAQLDLEVVAAGAAYRRLEPLRDLLGRDGLPVRPFGADETKRVSKAVIRHDPALRQRRLDLPGGVELDQPLGSRLDEEGRRRIEPFQVGIDERSAEHTSELQSLMRISYAVFCLIKKTHTHKQ